MDSQISQLIEIIEDKIFYYEINQQQNDPIHRFSYLIGNETISKAIISSDKYQNFEVKPNYSKELGFKHDLSEKLNELMQKYDLLNLDEIDSNRIMELFNKTMKIYYDLLFEMPSHHKKLLIKDILKYKQFFEAKNNSESLETKLLVNKEEIEKLAMKIKKQKIVIVKSKRVNFYT